MDRKSLIILLTILGVFWFMKGDEKSAASRATKKSKSRSKSSPTVNPWNLPKGAWPGARKSSPKKKTKNNPRKSNKSRVGTTKKRSPPPRGVRAAWFSKGKSIPSPSRRYPKSPRKTHPDKNPAPPRKQVKNKRKTSPPEPEPEPEPERTVSPPSDEEFYSAEEWEPVSRRVYDLAKQFKKSARKKAKTRAARVRKELQEERENTSKRTSKRRSR